MNEHQYIYAGFTKGGGTPDLPNWQLIPDTLEARQKALEEGYNAFSILSLSHEPTDCTSLSLGTELPGNLGEPLRKGPLVLDLDCKDNPKAAIKLARVLITKMTLHYNLHPDSVKYWLSGNKGCHIEIPASVLGSEQGHPYLHVIYKFMVFFLQRECLGCYGNKMIDMQMYNGKKGRLLRVENIRRDNGRYKVPVTSKEFLELDLDELEKLTKKPRLNFDKGHNPVPNPILSAKFNRLKDLIEEHRVADPFQILDAMSRCSFFNHCIDNAATLSEPEWWAFISNLAPLKDLGRYLAHWFSETYPGYSVDETDRKFDEAIKSCMPKTCAYLREQGFVQCPEECKMRAPCNLFKVKNISGVQSDFIHEKDGLYHREGDKLVKVCSPIKVIGYGCDYGNMGWCRLVELNDLMNHTKRIIIPMCEFCETGSKWLSTLLSAGLLLEGFRTAKLLLSEYIQRGEPECETVRISEKIGWTPDGGYLLPDKHFGVETKAVFTGEMETKFQVAGTLQDWQEQVGKYCEGNSLLELATSYALTGILLALTDSESGGLHIYGGSSKGKSTVATVAGSVCGGGSDGFIHQWRATDNALERVAASHNDNLLVLDEVSQVSSQALSNLAYMLPNQKGKMRMRSDGSNRRQYSWNLNFLSTGELTIADKIMEDSRLKSYAGQEVRIIDLPVDGGTAPTLPYPPLPFTDLHGVSSTREFSDLLKKNAKKTYGTPMRVFIEKLISDKDAIIQKIREKMAYFFNKNLPQDAGGQVQRVLRKFALIAATGEVAIEIGIFPYEKGSVRKASQQWFRIWLTDRNGLEDGEILKVINRLLEHFGKSLGQYCPLQEARFYPQNYPPRDIPGYTESNVEGEISKVFVLTWKLRELCGSVNMKALVEELIKRGWLGLTNKGRVIETKSIGGLSQRGLEFLLDKIF